MSLSRRDVLTSMPRYREVTPTELAEKLGTSPSNCMMHLKHLQDDGMVTVNRRTRPAVWKRRPLRKR